MSSVLDQPGTNEGRQTVCARNLFQISWINGELRKVSSVRIHNNSTGRKSAEELEAKVHGRFDGRL